MLLIILFILILILSKAYKGPYRQSIKNYKNLKKIANGTVCDGLKETLYYLGISLSIFPL